MAMSRGRIEFYKEHYPRGTRVQLDSNGRIIRFADNAMIRALLSREQSVL